MDLKDKKTKNLKRNGNEFSFAKATAGKIIIPPSGFISLTEAAKSSPYSQEYLSLLARRKKIFSKNLAEIGIQQKKQLIII